MALSCRSFRIIRDAGVVTIPLIAGHAPSLPRFAWSLMVRKIWYDKGSYSTNYCANYIIHGVNYRTDKYRCKKDSELPNPSQKISLMDMMREYTSEWYSRSKLPVNRHAGGVNILFLDGHVDWLLNEEVPVSYDPSGLSLDDRVKYWGPRWFF